MVVVSLLHDSGTDGERRPIFAKGDVGMQLKASEWHDGRDEAGSRRKGRISDFGS